MAYTNCIAVIDLGSSYMVGMVGTKDPTGSLSILAYEKESSANYIRRGCVYNVKETAFHINRLIQKMEAKLPNAKISKIYVGIGGQSIRTIEYTLSKTLGVDGVVAEDTIRSLQSECENYHPDLLDILDILPPVYYVDDKQESTPIGIPCHRLEARYKLIVGRPSLKRYILNCISEVPKVKIAGIIVSPSVLGDAVLSDEEKELGCALIDFGAGATRLTVYKNGRIAGISVIPLGSRLITSDIENLNLVGSEAERLKIAYGKAYVEKENDASISVETSNGTKRTEIKLLELNTIVEARVREVFENVYARLDAIGMTGSMGSGVVITGGGAALKNLPELIKEIFDMEVRYSTVRKGIVNNDYLIANNPDNTVAISLLMKGTENCMSYVEPEPERQVVTDEKDSFVKPEEKSQPKQREKEKQKGSGLFGGLRKGIDSWGRGLFDDENL